MIQNMYCVPCGSKQMSRIRVVAWVRWQDVSETRYVEFVCGQCGTRLTVEEDAGV